MLHQIQSDYVIITPKSIASELIHDIARIQYRFYPVSVTVKGHVKVTEKKETQLFKQWLEAIHIMSELVKKHGMIKIVGWGEILDEKFSFLRPDSLREMIMLL